MKSVFMVIIDNGDGSQSIERHKTMSQEKEDRLVANDKYDSYASGDGFQCRELKFPEDFNIEAFGFQTIFSGLKTKSMTKMIQRSNS